MPRIAPLEPPYAPDTEQQLASMMPPGVPPIAIFRTFVKNPPMAAALRGWGGYELSPDLSLSLREREILINRTCARCGCEYEWGVHIAFFAERAELDAAQVTSLTHGTADDECWTSGRERALVRMADQLHDTSTVDDTLWGEVTELFTEAELLDALLLVGWYHAISYTANGAGVQNEEGAPVFADYLS